MATLQQKELYQTKALLCKYRDYNKAILNDCAGDHPAHVELRMKAKDRLNLLEDVLDALGGDLSGLKRLTTGL